LSVDNGAVADDEVEHAAHCTPKGGVLEYNQFIPLL
jgi:hypothetical protein